MRLWRIVFAATGAELAAGAACAAVLGLCGSRQPWLDLLNQFAPIWLLSSLIGGLLALAFTPPGRDRQAELGVAAVGALASLTVTLPEILRSICDELRPQSERAVLRVVTLNAWSDNIDPQRTIQVILAAHPDVVAVQEETGRLLPADAALIRALPYRISCLAGSDLAIYTASRPIAHGCGDLESTASRPGFVGPVWVRVVGHDGLPATIASVHLPWPAPLGQQEFDSRALADVIHELPVEPLVLTGDFNAAPWSFDMRRLDRRLRPLIRRSHAIFTWPARVGWRGWRVPIAILPIDQVYAGPGWGAVSVKRLPLTGSDHYGLVASFSRRP